MSADIIRNHFVQFLGADVGVSFSDPENPRHVVLYRPDRLSDSFVVAAFEALDRTSPNIARSIDRLLVSFDTRLGRTQRRVELPLSQRAAGVPSTTSEAAL